MTEARANMRRRVADPGRALARVEGFTEGRRLQAQILALGERLRELREGELGLSQTQAAKLIGLEQSELSRSIENGVGSRGPSYSTIARIIEAYQAALRERDASARLSLSIQLRRGDERAPAAQGVLAGSA